MADINVKDVDKDKKNKAMFVLKCKGRNLSQEIKNMINRLASEYDLMN